MGQEVCRGRGRGGPYTQISSPESRNYVLETRNPVPKTWNTVHEAWHPRPATISSLHLHHSPFSSLVISAPPSPALETFARKSLPALSLSSLPLAP